MKEWWELMEERGTRRDTPMKPQVVAQSWASDSRDDAIVSCDSRHDHHLVRAAHPGAARADVLAARATWRRMAQRPALRDRGADRLSRPPVRRLRRRRRLLDADGRVRHRREVPAADQGRRHQEQHARPDQVGADGLPRQPRVRRASCSRSTSPRSPGVRRRPASGSRTRPSAAPSSTRRSARAGPVVVEAVVDPFEPPMPPKVTVEQALKFAEVARAGRAEPREDRPDRAQGQGARANLSDGSSCRS